MKKQIGTIKDGRKFKVSNRKSGAIYKVIKNYGQWVIYTSLSSELSFAAKKDKVVYGLK